MTIHVPASPALRLFALLFGAIAVTGSGPAAQAQDTPVEAQIEAPAPAVADAPLPVADEAPLDPLKPQPGDEIAAPAPAVPDAPLPMADAACLDELKPLLGDESAYLDKMWSLGNAEMERVGDLLGALRQNIPPDERALKQAELQQRTANLKAICAFSLQHFAQSAEVHNFHGTVLYDILGEQLEGVKEWHTSISLDSKYSDPYNNLGMHYFHAGSYTLGFQNMDKALELDPKSPDYCYNMAQNYLIYRPQTEEFRGWDAKRVYKEAMKLSKKATKLAPEDFELLQDYAVNFLAAENFGEEPDWKAATKAWVAARKYARTDVEKFYTWLNEGRAWRAMGNHKEARRCFESALIILPGNKITERLLNETKAGK